MSTFLGTVSWALFPEKPLRPKEDAPRLTWAVLWSNARGARSLWAENSAASGMNCRCSRAAHSVRKPDFIQVFPLARRLLTDVSALTAACRDLWSCRMLFALGAVSSALDALQSLTSSKTSSAQQTGLTQGATNPFSIDSGSSTSSGATSSVKSGNRPHIAPETMSALISAQSQSSTSSSPATGSASSSSTSTTMSRQDALKDLFSKIDADGDGKITKSEFENALGAGGTNLAQADDVFSKLDANSNGSVSLDEMSKALKGGHRGHHRAQSGGGSGDASGGGSGSSQASSGSTRTPVVNSDGSTSTTIKYADGFKVTMTVPGASSASGAGNSPYNWFEQMMQRQAQASSASSASSTSMSV
jgi:hypothetical protein